MEALRSALPLTCLPCTKTLVILGARLSTSLVKRLAARRTTDLMGDRRHKNVMTGDTTSSSMRGILLPIQHNRTLVIYLSSNVVTLQAVSKGQTGPSKGLIEHYYCVY